MGFRYEDTVIQSQVQNKETWQVPLGKRVPHKEIYAFFVDLQAYYKAGESFDKAFQNMADDDRHPLMKTALEEMRRDVLESNPLSEVFAKQKIFPPFCAGIIRAGERTGVLDKVLDEIGKYIKADGDVRESIKSSLLLPKMVFSLLGIAMAIIFTQVIPKYQDIYRELKIELPLLTRIVFGAYTFCSANWLLVLVVLGLAAVYGVRFYRKNAGRIKLLIPVYSRLYQKILQYRFCRSFGLFLAAGAGAPEALRFTGDSMDNDLAKQSLYRAAEKLMEGLPLAETVRECNTPKIIQSMPLHFLKSGQETGRTPELLDQAANHYMDEITMETKDFSTRISAVLLIPTAAFELVMLLAIMLPSYSLALGAQ